jgi:hypothetical protein
MEQFAHLTSKPINARSFLTTKKCFSLPLKPPRFYSLLCAVGKLFTYENGLKGLKAAIC